VVAIIHRPGYGLLVMMIPDDAVSSSSASCKSIFTGACTLSDPQIACNPVYLSLSSYLILLVYMAGLVSIINLAFSSTGDAIKRGPLQRTRFVLAPSCNGAANVDIRAPARPPTQTQTHPQHMDISSPSVRILFSPVLQLFLGGATAGLQPQGINHCHPPSAIIN
jgi:hypothetical protein